MTGWLDTLPPAVRHGLIVFFGTLVGTYAVSVANAFQGTGLDTFDWTGSVAPALAAAVAATLAALGITGLTPLTQQYGVKGKVTVPSVNGIQDDEA